MYIYICNIKIIQVKGKDKVYSVNYCSHFLETISRKFSVSIYTGASRYKYKL